MTQQRYYQLKIQAQGRLVVPSDVRSDLGVKEGDEVLLVRDEGGYRLTTRKALIDAVVGALARDDGRDLTEEFLEDRRREAREKGW